MEGSVKHSLEIVKDELPIPATADVPPRGAAFGALPAALEEDPEPAPASGEDVNPFEHIAPCNSRVKQVWALGGGKGGIGKSLIASSLAITLARLGSKVVAVDLDLGGANLHTTLGVDLRAPPGARADQQCRPRSGRGVTLARRIRC